MHIAKKIFYQTIRLANLSLLKKSSGNRLLLPYHHLVSDEQVPHVKHLYPYKGIKAFQEDLDYLLRHFRPVGLQEVLKSIQEQQPLPSNAFLLTFDDGLKEVSEVIAPLLLRKGIPAVFFLNTAFLDNQELFYRFKISLIIDALFQQPHSGALQAEMARILALPSTPDLQQLVQAVKGITYKKRNLTDELGTAMDLSFDTYLRKQQPFMSTAQVQQLVEQGFAIGGHSIDHPYYKELSLEEMLHQTTASVNVLAERFKLPYKVFAFPHSDAGIPAVFFDRLLKGPQPALDLIFGTNNQRTDIYPEILHRFNCERPEISITAAVKGILFYNYWQRRKGKAAIHRQQV
ncbi:polysaccharide deacetylase family protein [Chitinophaga sp. HK235]|uniref:polysaccharide deacetylase family protein n=1 Tax=Chitinophaga sp. HK235 TaxID=2952571 RepID=UPI001BA7C5E2|nr:polysaccharide deacetylase family protein [Chitinophaga sp. HK235]